MKLEESAIYKRYIDQNRQSQEHAARAALRIPSGTSRSLLLHPPFPFYITHASGVVGTDLDGNQRLDFHNNYTTLIHGHGHPQVLAAVTEQLPHGTTYSAPGTHEYALAELLCERIGSVDQVVFNNSGTEAVMVALRIARACTGRNRIGKFEGAYHGSGDFVMVGGHELPTVDDPVRVSTPRADVAGLPASVTADVVLMRYNDPQAVRDACRMYGSELAAIVVEPILGAGGVIPAEREFLEVLREETAHAGIVLICDEVITLRQALGGAQGYYGLEPDLTTMAKTIGGGFPIGAVGGRRELMACLGTGGSVANLGTFSANPISACAGLAAMRMLDEAALGELNALGEQAREGLRASIARYDLAAQITGSGSLFQIHWTRAPLRDARGAAEGNEILKLLMFLGLANRGVQLSMRGMAALSTPMNSGHIDTLITAFDETVKDLCDEGWC